MTILSYLERFYFTERELERGSRLFILFKVGIFGSWLGHTPRLDDLNSETLNRFILARLDERSRETVRGERSCLRAIWNDAHERGLIDLAPSRIRKIKKQLGAPEAWTESELKSLLAEAAKQRGMLRGKGIARAAYWRMFFLVAYSTGLRLGDLERLTTAQLRGPGTYRINQHKTGKPLDITIDEPTWQAIAATNPAKRKYVIRVLGRGAFFDALKIIVDNCGLHGRTKMIRKSAGSLFEREYPGEGHKLLGNGRDVFLRHYADPKIIDKPGRLPPRLNG